MNNIQNISDNYLCSNCGACVFACPKNAIRFETSNIGRLYPVIDNSCIDCGICKKVCPSIDSIGLHRRNKDKYVGEILESYIGRSTDHDFYQNAQSGGVCTAILCYLFDTGKIDAALVCRLDSNSQVEIIPVASKGELIHCQKSIYTPVPLLSALDKIKGYNSVAIVGIPCHIQGIVSLIEHKCIKNIKYRIGLICEKVLCKSILNSLMSFTNFTNGKIIWKAKGTTNGKFYPYQTAPIVIKTTEKSVVLPRNYRMSLKQFFTAPRCYVCYDKLNTFADIVLGDPWGCKNVDLKNGDSLVLVRTKVGEDVFNEMISGKYVDVKREVGLDEVLAGQYIKGRRKSVTIYSKVLAEKSSTETYLCKQTDCDEVSQKEISQAEEIIDTFIRRESLSKGEIINEAREVIKRAELKDRINKNLLVRIIRKIIRTFK